mgnify:FL=1
MDFEEKTLASEYVYKGRILNLRKDEIALSDGARSVREIVEHSGGSCVLCVKDGKILLVKQFRYAYKKAIWEIPAGKINKGEDPKETAVRELEEESGVKAEKAELLIEIYPSPGYTDEIIRMYRVSGLSDGKTHFDADERIESRWFDTEEAKKMAKNGEINDAKTLIALSFV